MQFLFIENIFENPKMRHGRSVAIVKHQRSLKIAADNWKGELRDLRLFTVCTETGRKKQDVYVTDQQQLGSKRVRHVLENESNVHRSPLDGSSHSISNQR